MTKQILTMSDHDILITLVESVKNNHTNLVERIEDVKNDVRIIKDTDLREIKDATNLKLAEHEARIRALETIANEYKPGPLVDMLRSHEQWIHDFRLTWKIVLGITATASAVVTFILTTVTQAMNLFGGK